MKIIKAPMPLSDWTMQLTCPTCGAVVEIDGNDVCCTFYGGDMRDAEPSSWSYFVKCPISVCTRAIGIKGADIPIIVQLNAQKESARS